MSIGLQALCFSFSIIGDKSSPEYLMISDQARLRYPDPHPNVLLKSFPVPSGNTPIGGKGLNDKRIKLSITH